MFETGPCFVLFTTTTPIPKVDMPLAMMLVYLAMNTSPYKLSSCFSYTKGCLASIRIPRLAVLNPPFHNFLTFLTSLGGRSLLAVIFVALPGSPHKRQPFHNTMAQAFLGKPPLFGSGNSSPFQWFSIIMIYPIPIALCTYVTYTHIYNSHLKFHRSLPHCAGPHNPIQFLHLLALQVFTWLTTTKAADRKHPLFLRFYVFSSSQSIFNFLRCPGPRRLGASRRVLVDGDEYQIMQVGRGAFATISRVLHKPSADLRVMKRIVFDKSGLAKELAEAEVNSLRAMAGSFWFPTLLNHFADDDEYIITMVCLVLDCFRSYSTSCLFFSHSTLVETWRV